MQKGPSRSKTKEEAKKATDVETAAKQRNRAKQVCDAFSSRMQRKGSEYCAFSSVVSPSRTSPCSFRCFAKALLKLYLLFACFARQLATAMHTDSWLRGAAHSLLLLLLLSRPLTLAGPCARPHTSDGRGCSHSLHCLPMKARLCCYNALREPFSPPSSHSRAYYLDALELRHTIASLECRRLYRAACDNNACRGEFQLAHLE